MGRVGSRFQNFGYGKEKFIHYFDVPLCDKDSNIALKVMFKICYRTCRIEFSDDDFFYGIGVPSSAGGGEQRMGQCPNCGTFVFC